MDGFTDGLFGFVEVGDAAILEAVGGVVTYADDFEISVIVVDLRDETGGF